jgi:hypothetical protein
MTKRKLLFISVAVIAVLAVSAVVAVAQGQEEKEAKGFIIRLSPFRLLDERGKLSPSALAQGFIIRLPPRLFPDEERPGAVWAVAARGLFDKTIYRPPSPFLGSTWETLSS